MEHAIFWFLCEMLRLFDYFSAGKIVLPEIRQVGAAGTALPNLLQVEHD